MDVSDDVLNVVMTTRSVYNQLKCTVVCNKEMFAWYSLFRWLSTMAQVI